MDREYVKVPKSKSLPFDTSQINSLDDDFWIEQVFHYLLNFYKNYNKEELKQETDKEREKQYPRIENCIAKYIRKYLRNNRAFEAVFDVNGESQADSEIEGYYDIKISNTFWKKKNYFPIECKNLNLNSKNNYVNKYVYYKQNKEKFDGGVYRYFNGKYAQHQDFGGMLGFVIEDDLQKIKEKIVEKLRTPFDISPAGDLINKEIQFDSINDNDFTFTSYHRRMENEFSLYHILIQLN